MCAGGCAGPDGRQVGCGYARDRAHAGGSEAPGRTTSLQHAGPSCAQACADRVNANAHADLQAGTNIITHHRAAAPAGAERPNHS